MASVAEVKAQLQQANIDAGEAYGALHEAREQMQRCLAEWREAEEKIGAAIGKLAEAGQAAGAALDGSGHEYAEQAWGNFTEAGRQAVSIGYHAEAEAEERMRACIAMTEEQAQNSIIAGQNACEMYMSSM